jgi:endonuclease/exonuclease/phosphatase (EEP) superfamily protein YafD
LDLITPLVQLISYTPYVAAASVLPLAFALLLRRWREALAAVAVVAAFGAFVVPRAVAEPGGSGTGDTLVVMTVNVLAGGADTDRIMALVRAQHPDLLSVQELTDEAVARLDAAGIARELPQRALRPRDGVAGTGLYATYPLIDPRGLADSSTFDMARATMRTPGRDLDVIAVHTGPPLPGGPTGRWQRDFDLLPRPGGLLRILAGDFNATVDHRELRRLIGTGYRDAADTVGAGLTPTWPNGHPLPPVTIDHVLVDRRTGVRSVRVFDVPLSDHRAVVVRLRLPS